MRMMVCQNSSLASLLQKPFGEFRDVHQYKNKKIIYTKTVYLLSPQMSYRLSACGKHTSGPAHLISSILDICVLNDPKTCSVNIWINLE